MADVTLNVLARRVLNGAHDLTGLTHGLGGDTMAARTLALRLDRPRLLSAEELRVFGLAILQANDEGRLSPDERRSLVGAYNQLGDPYGRG